MGPDHVQAIRAAWSVGRRCLPSMPKVTLTSPSCRQAIIISIRHERLPRRALAGV